MKLIVGLGNPEIKYDGTRHNFGFRAVDYSVEALGGGNWVKAAKFNALTARLDVADQAVIFLKPLTFYNLVGQSVRSIVDFYRLDLSDVLVIHDDMALPLGMIRARLSGSDAGNNGIKNIISHLGKDFARIRIGSGKIPDSNGNAQPNSGRKDYVLAKITKKEQATFNEVLPKVLGLEKDFISGNFTSTSINI